MSKERGALAEAQMFLARADLKGNLTLYYEADRLLGKLVELPDDPKCKGLKKRLNALITEYANEAYTRLLSKAAGDDMSALDVVARIAQGERQAFSGYFEELYGVYETPEEEQIEAAQKLLSRIYKAKGTPPYWQHVLKRAEDGAAWAHKALRDAVLSQTAQFETKAEWARVALALQKAQRR